MLHASLERAGTLGVLGLDDLLALPQMRPHPTANKLRLTARIPRRPGVYRFRDRAKRDIYIGRASNLRTQVRAHFHGDLRRKVPQMLHETASIEWIELPDVLEASVTEARLIRELDPRFNRKPGRKKKRKQPARPGRPSLRELRRDVAPGNPARTWSAGRTTR